MLSRHLNSWSFALAFGLAAAPGARAEIWAVKPEQSPVTFLATGKPGFLKIKGEGGQVEGAAQLEQGKLQGSFNVALAPLKSGIELRDEHMHGKYLESAKFPVARLVIDPVAVDARVQPREYEFMGKLTLKGVEKPIQGTLSLSFDGAAAKGRATFVVKLSDYPVGVPSHLGVTVAETVQVDAEFVAERQVDVAQKP